MVKGIMKSEAAARLASFLIGTYLHLVSLTGRKTITDRAHYDEALAEGRGVILVFWHGRLMAAPFIRKETDAEVHMLVSRHRDGQIITDAVKGFGLNFIRGSAANPKKPEKNKHGAPAVTQMIDILETGETVAITPDGPRGPAETVQIGAIKLAEMSGAKIVPVGISASRGRRLKTWDRFLFAGLFSHFHYVAGRALAVPSGATEEELQALRSELEHRMKAATARADDLASRPKDAQTETQ